MTKKIAQGFLPLYGLLLIAGGLMGYRKGSQESLYAGAGSGVLTLLLAALSLKKPRLSFALSSLVAATLTGVMGWRWDRTGHLMPAGIVSIISFFATGIEAAGAIKGE